ncbi:MAG TPA: hypothetical protein VGA08_01605, partial [Candidatus Saccharimonadales bacterium]
ISHTSTRISVTTAGILTLSGYNCSANANGGALTANSSGVISCTDDDGGGTSEWTDTGTFLHPADLSGAEDVGIGGTTTGTADILLQATGGAIFNQNLANVDFQIGGSTLANALYVDASADSIGFGTSAPQSRLHVMSAGDAGLTLEADTNDDNIAQTAFLKFSKSGATHVGYLGLVGAAGTLPGGGSYTGTVANSVLLATTTATPISVGTNNQVRFQVGSSGPVHVLDIGATSLISPSGNNFDIQSTATNGPVFTMIRHDTTSTVGNSIGRIDFYNNDTELTTQNIYAQIQVVAAQTISTDAAAGELLLKTTGTAVAGAPIERVRINETGVGIGNFTPGARLDVNENTGSSNIDIFRVISDVGGTDNVKLSIDSDGDLALDGSISVLDAQGLTLGTSNDATLSYDEAGEDRVELTGTNANLFIEDRLSLGVDARTISDNGTGANATLTLNPNSAYVEITCNDAQGCDITMAEAAPVRQGNVLVAVNLSAVNVNFADTANVTELAGVFAAGQYDSITMMYLSDRWVELSRSNN